LVCGLAAWAQPRVPVTVEVKDPSGALVPRALVAFSQPTRDPAAKAETDAEGRATVALVPGSYALNVQAPGFRVERESVAFTAATKLPVTLDVGETCPPCQRVIVASEEQIPTQAPVLMAMIQSATAPATAPGYTPVTVVVTGPDGAAVAGAEIRVTPGSPAGDKLIADEQGRAQLGIPAGEYELHVSAQGFTTADHALMVAGGPQTVTVSLVPAPASNGESEGAGPAPMSPGAVPLESTTEGSGHAANVATQPATALTILGANGERGVFTPQTLGEYPQKTVTVFDPHAKKQMTYGGVPLMDLLAKLGVKHGKDLMGKALAQYVVATGADGYVSVVGLGEVDPEFHPGTVLVADTMNGKRLDAKAGPFRLVVSEDKRPARSVRNLVRIEVRTAE
jgi:hypothetical protein